MNITRKIALWLIPVLLLCILQPARAATSTRYECITPTGEYPTHLWGPWVVREQATCRRTGTEVRTCRRCGKTETQTIPKGRHVYGPWQVTVPATCISAGSSVRHCTVCGLSHTRDIPADPEAHKWGEWTTDDASGIRMRVCSLCGAVEREDGTTGRDGTVYVTKEEYSESADPAGYRLGEKVKWKITVTNAHTMAVDVTVWDQIFSLDDPEKVGDATLAAGEKREFIHEYTVREEDVTNTLIDDIARVVVQIPTVLAGAAAGYEVYSDMVRVPVIKGGGPTPVVINPPIQPPVTDPPSGEGSACRRVLTGQGSASDAYECTFCAEHHAVEQKTRKMSASRAREVWTQAVNECYDALAAKYAAAASLIERDRELFFKQLDLYGRVLSGAAGSVRAGEMVLDDLRDRCIDLCYALHFAPEERPDSPRRSGVPTLTTGARAGTCLRERETTASGFLLTETLCASHLYIGIAPTASAATADPVWTRRQWEAALTSVTGALYASLPAASSSRIADSLTLFLQWTDARGAVLKALYPDDTVAAEVLVFTVRGRAMDLENAAK